MGSRSKYRRRHDAEYGSGHADGYDYGWGKGRTRGVVYGFAAGCLVALLLWSACT
jgi:hypothetical protein